MPPVEFEPTISAGEWSQTYALDRTATGIGRVFEVSILNKNRHRLIFLRKRLQYKMLQN